MSNQVRVIVWISETFYAILRNGPSDVHLIQIHRQRRIVSFFLTEGSSLHSI